jgi:periplasmic protein TonB
MMRRSPAVLLLVLGMHLALAWALIAQGTGLRSEGSKQPSQIAPTVIPVSLPSIARTANPGAQDPPAPAPQYLRPPGPAAKRQAFAVPALPAPVPSAAPEAAGALPMARPPEDQPVVGAAVLPSAAEALGAPELAARETSTPTQARSTSGHVLPLVAAQADRQRCPPAPHPAALRERGIEGAVLLRVKVDAHGMPASVHVQTGSGWRLFDEAAVQQVRACRFIPATQGGQTIDSWVEFPVRFALAG